MTAQRVVRLVDGPMGSTRGLTWPADVEWPEILWAGNMQTPDGQDAVMLSPGPQPTLHRYRKIRQSSLSDDVVEGVRIIRGAEYVWSPPVTPEDPDLEAAGESALSPELDP